MGEPVDHAALIKQYLAWFDSRMMHLWPLGRYSDRLPPYKRNKKWCDATRGYLRKVAGVW